MGFLFFNIAYILFNRIKMINFSKISQYSLPGKFFRGVFGFIPNFLTLRIIQGPLKGKKWIKGAGVNGYWLGSYELNEQEELRKMINPGDVIYDIGAHAGFHSLLMSNFAGGKGLVFSFEPFPRNIEFLKKHVALNGVKNISVMEMAIGNMDGVTGFAEGRSTFEGKIDSAGMLKVKIAKIDTLVGKKVCPPPNFIKVDIEGKFGEFILGAKKTIKQYKPKILFEAQIVPDMSSFEYLKSIGYAINPVGTSDVAVAINFTAVYPPII